MLCEICNEREANVVFTEVVNGKVTEHNLCMECARNSDFGQKNYAAFFDGGSHLGRLLSGLLGMALNNNGESENADGQNVVCPVCKTSYKDFVNRSRFGCADCYDVFELLMEDHIKNLQGNTNHVGKRPMKAKSRVETESKQMNDISAEDRALLQALFGDDGMQADASAQEGNPAQADSPVQDGGQAQACSQTQDAGQIQACSQTQDAGQVQACSQTQDAGQVQACSQTQDAGQVQACSQTAACQNQASAVSSDSLLSELQEEVQGAGITAADNNSNGIAAADNKDNAVAAAANQGSAIVGNAGPAAVEARTRAQIAVMKNQLKKALEEENYAGAAHLRDQIHALEDALKEGGAAS